MLDYITEETTTMTARLDALMAELSEYRDEHKIYAEAAQGATAVQSLATLSLNRADQQIQMKQIDNVLATGRCVAADNMMLNYTRLIAPCMITGHAAGAAGALAVSEKCAPRHVAVPKLRELLKKQGAYLG